MCSWRSTSACGPASPCCRPGLRRLFGAASSYLGRLVFGRFLSRRTNLLDGGLVLVHLTQGLGVEHSLDRGRILRGPRLLGLRARALGLALRCARFLAASVPLFLSHFRFFAYL
jgi:hypothetical protein